MRTIVVAQNGNSSRMDKIAKKYCFRASARIVRAETGQPYAMFTSFDANPDIARRVEESAQEFVAGMAEVERLVAEPADLVMYPECPVELTNDVYFARLA